MAKLLRRRRAGFTLIELLVAISVLAVVAVLGWRGLDGIVRARIALNQQLAQTRGLQLAFAQLQSDCARIVPASLHCRAQRAGGRSGAACCWCVRYMPTTSRRACRWSATVCTTGVLTRQESVPTRDLAELDGLWLAAQNNSASAPAVVLESDLAAMTVRIWGADRPGWRSSADAALAGANASPGAAAPQPTGLEVALQLRGQQTSMVKVFLLGAV